MPILSLIVPCYNEQETLRPFMQELYAVLASLHDIEAEVILVNDGSADETLPLMRYDRRDMRTAVKVRAEPR